MTISEYILTLLFGCFNGIVLTFYFLRYTLRNVPICRKAVLKVLNELESCEHCTCESDTCCYCGAKKNEPTE